MNTNRLTISIEGLHLNLIRCIEILDRIHRHHEHANVASFAQDFRLKLELRIDTRPPPEYLVVYTRGVLILSIHWFPCDCEIASFAASSTDVLRDGEGSVSASVHLR